MRQELYQEVVITRDAPEADLRQNDVATLIDYIANPSGGEDGAVLEVYHALGESITVVTIPASSIAPIRSDQVPAVRTLASPK